MTVFKGVVTMLRGLATCKANPKHDMLHDLSPAELTVCDLWFGVPAFEDT